MIDPTTALAFSMYENKGVFALLLGSGVSRAAQIPTGWEITLDLVRRIAGLTGITDQPNWAKWHHEQFGKEPSYSELLDQLSITPDERRSILHSYIEPTADDFAEGKKVPTKAHHAIARLVQAGFIRVIITTNFDRLLENALRDVGVEPMVIKSDDDLKGAVPLIHSRCFILKVHGDYLDTRIRNTERELSAYTPEVDVLLDRVFDEHGLIVCGWSADWDPALKAAITRAPNRRYPLFWATRGKASQLAQDLIALRGGKEIIIEGADPFFENLERLVRIQSDLQQPNPRSTELMVASAKKYLGKPEYRIQLGDLIQEETKHLITSTQSGPFASQGNLDKTWFINVISRYEGSSEPLARIFGVLGRWGLGAEFDDATEIIKRFAARGSGNGSVIILALETYPAVLLLYAYGIGLLKAKRFKELFRLFSAEVTTARSNELSPLVQSFFLDSWSRGDNDWWKLLPGFDGRTALSNHLHDIFALWTDDYLLGLDEFTLLFEEFELLGSLAYLTTIADLKTLKEAATPDTWGCGFVWAPPGRIAWDSSNRERILKSFTNPEKVKLILDAGFARGEEEFLREALAGLRRLFGRISMR
jgi:hypothetical protein